MRSFVFFFRTQTATPDIYTLSLHDALPISEIVGAGSDGVAPRHVMVEAFRQLMARGATGERPRPKRGAERSEEHTSELQSHVNIVCRLLLEKKKKRNYIN